MVNDLIFAAGSAILGVSLIPAVVRRTIVPRASSIPTAAILTVFVGNYAAIGYTYAAATTALTAACWWALVFTKRAPVITGDIHVHLDATQICNHVIEI